MSAKKGWGRRMDGLDCTVTQPSLKGRLGGGGSGWVRTSAAERVTVLHYASLPIGMHQLRCPTPSPSLSLPSHPHTKAPANTYHQAGRLTDTKKNYN